MIIDTDNLLTATNYGEKIGKSRHRVYQMVKEARIAPIYIDGVMFVNDPNKKKNDTDK